MRPRNIKRLQRRAKRLRAYMVNPHTVVVQSVTNPVANHIVTVNFQPGGVIRARCTCPWALNGGVACSHVIAALEHLAERKGRTLSFWPSRQQAERQHRRLFYLAGTNDDGVWITSRAA